MSEIRGLAREISSLSPVIDVLVNNAGLFTLTRSETVDGLEMQLAVNWLWHGRFERGKGSLPSRQLYP
ncbi:MAG: hypothetical protein ABSG85_11485 [Spirochaetia bacterium]|jgi:NAD(P)-dependent dehydrogenase (short-subunit alcohol dehydrogenase family)